MRASPAQRDDAEPPEGKRITVNLVPRAFRALEEAMALTGDGQTDTVNRALPRNAYLERVAASGGTFYVREAPDGEIRAVKFLL